MPNGLIFKVSRLFGFSAFTSEGDFDPRLMFRPILSFTLWMSSYILCRIFGLSLTREENSPGFLSISVLILQHILGAVCLSYHLFISAREKSKIESILKTVSSVEPSGYDRMYLIFGSCLPLMTFQIHYSVIDRTVTTQIPLFLSAYFVYSELLIVLQFCSLMKRLSTKFRELKRDIIFHRRVDYLRHSALIDLAADTNRIYDVQLFLVCTNIFATIIHSAYDFYNHLDNLLEAYPSLTAFALSIVRAILTLIWLSGACEEINADADSFNMELFDLMRENEELCSNDAFYIYVLVRQSVQISACGYFNVGYPLVTSVIAAATTYLVILIQFA